MSEKTHWKKLINLDYLGAYILQPGEELTVTIEKVVREIVTSGGGKKEECTVAYLRGHKPLILNITKQKTIDKIYGPYIEDWVGKSITLLEGTTRFGGETVACLLVKMKVPEKVKTVISTERFKKGLDQITVGDFTSERMRTNFILTPEQEKALDAHIKLLTTGEINHEPATTEYAGEVQDQGERAASDHDGTEKQVRESIAGS